MHRDPLLRLLSSYRQQHTSETSAIDQLIGFVQNYPDCFERSLLCGHVTGSAWLVNSDGTHVLLTHHCKLNRWLQLGGHADGDADIQRVALREAQEESGLADIKQIIDGVFDIDIHSIPARKSEPGHLHYDVRFAFKAIADQRFVVSDESNELAWVPIATLAARSKTAPCCERAGFDQLSTLISLNRQAIRLNQDENLPQTSTLSRRHLFLNGLLADVVSDQSMLRMADKWKILTDV